MTKRNCWRCDECGFENHELDATCQNCGFCCGNCSSKLPVIRHCGVEAWACGICHQVYVMDVDPVDAFERVERAVHKIVMTALFSEDDIDF